MINMFKHKIFTERTTKKLQTGTKNYDLIGRGFRLILKFEELYKKKKYKKMTNNFRNLHEK